MLIAARAFAGFAALGHVYIWWVSSERGPSEVEERARAAHVG